jgi:hypothetical protein
VLISHAVVRLLQVFEQSSGKTTECNKNKSFLVENIDLLGDEEGGQTGTKGDIASLGDKGVSGQRVNNASGLLLGLNYYEIMVSKFMCLNGEMNECLQDRVNIVQLATCGVEQAQSHVNCCYNVEFVHIAA